MTDRIVLNVNDDDLDVVHVNPREECNIDDSIAAQLIDATTANAMLAEGVAVRCGHCNTEETHL